MTINIIRLPKNAFLNILKFSDIQSQLRLRQVSKSVQEFVDFSVLQLKKSIVKSFVCEEIFIAIKSPVQNAEIEAIQQILHSNHKKWRIEADTETGAMDIKVGMYAVKTKEDLGRNKRMITIKKIQH
uniref:F-box domain-containing protein n=1 Tax=Pristionchus pacificus TaxID=54126 RepID=A0A2A6CRY7_PRIPA|eukprot:PDM80791.1 F-box domain-containing protein [Pristionchus pacificus]